jgi:hypothetical protein
MEPSGAWSGGERFAVFGHERHVRTAINSFLSQFLFEPKDYFDVKADGPMSAPNRRHVVYFEYPPDVPGRDLQHFRGGGVVNFYHGISFGWQGCLACKNVSHEVTKLVNMILDRSCHMK